MHVVVTRILYHRALGANTAGEDALKWRNSARTSLGLFHLEDIWNKNNAKVVKKDLFSCHCFTFIFYELT